MSNIITSSEIWECVGSNKHCCGLVSCEVGIKLQVSFLYVYIYIRVTSLPNGLTVHVNSAILAICFVDLYSLQINYFTADNSYCIFCQHNSISSRWGCCLRHFGKHVPSSGTVYSYSECILQLA